MSPAPCAVVAARDPALADRMWSTVEVDGEETVDPDARRRARLICRKCPLRASCLTDSIQGGWKTGTWSAASNTAPAWPLPS